jgi:hypothetical protein
MPDQLSVTNEALSRLAEREITPLELSEGLTESARVMAGAWPQAVDACLSAKPWRFCSRLANPTYEGQPPDEHANFAAPGYSYAYAIPDDHLRTNWVRDRSPPDGLPIDFLLQDNYWHTNCSTLVASYVSHQYRSPETWPPLFADVVAAYLAWRRGPRIRPAADQNELRLTYEAELDRAATQDASEVPFGWRPAGRLTRSRGGWRSREQGLRW